MKILYNFLPLFLFASSVIYGQTPKDSLPAKVSEHKEINATNHLKKEMEQKQLTAPPERIADTAASLQTADKPKYRKCMGARRNKD